MKKIIHILIPLLTFPFLSCCNKPTPAPISEMYHLKVTGDNHCYVQGSENAVYEQDFAKDRTDITIPLFVQEKYVIDVDQCVIPDGITLNNNLLVIAKMNQNYEVTIKSNHIQGYWFEFKGENCQITSSTGETTSELKEFIQIEENQEKIYPLNLDNGFILPTGEIQPGVVIINNQGTGYSLRLTKIDRNFKINLTAYNTENLDMFLRVDLSDMIVPIYYFYCAGTNVEVDWGDGSEKSTGSEGYFGHTYSEAGVHKIFITSGSITSFSFSEDPYLLEAYLLNDITSINDYAFYECQNLSSVIMTSNIVSIGNSAFYDCTSIASINFSDSITSIGDSAFYNCSQIPAVTLPSNLETIEDNAFYNCSKISYINFPTNKNLSIGDSAFYGCAVTEIFIPEKVISIGINPFAACYNLKRIRIDSNNQHYECSNDGNVIIGINDRCVVSGCYTSKIPSTVYIIGMSAFYGCWSLKEMNLPQGLIRVDTAAFTSCENLETVTVPNSVTSFGGNSFAFCYNLKKVDLTAYSDPNNLPSSAVGMFLYTHKDLTIYVKNDEIKEALSNKGFWSDYKIEVA